ncbi:cell division protein FtsQ [Mucilaginibacter gracilis]|uniref:Cell division protein FtsQ n=1 Tax=Mucilaginibacter gracilis TaxID=423350 RepID=A0A495J8X6_9SPHI|nr:cell division protein FtsQ [Mucilaginibacter gracilis]RKR85455.1 cell division protein FtsQ [Mucilaginibacter gracilis]
MFKNPVWRKILIGFAWVTGIGGIVALMSFIEHKQAGVVCTEVKIFIPGNQYFIDKEEVDNILQVKSNALIGHKLEDINIHALEEKLRANPFIESAEVYMEMDGVIHVSISQRQPILRIVNKYDQDFYIDQHGLKIPLSQNFTARVLVATGQIDELFANRVDSVHNDIAKNLFKTADFIRKDSLWNAQIVQIYVNNNHELELIPRVGNHRILLGNADSLSNKFANLLAFYKQALPKVGQDAYTVINIKYANQVVGIKGEALLKQDSINKRKALLNKSTDKPDTAGVKEEF